MVKVDGLQEKERRLLLATLLGAGGGGRVSGQMPMVSMKTAAIIAPHLTKNRRCSPNFVFS